MNGQNRPYRQKAADGRPEVVNSDNVFGGTEVEDRELALSAENAALRDRLLRALADAENTRRQAERSGSDARQYAVLEFAREMLGVADNLKRTIDAVERQSYRSTEDALLIQGVRATERMFENILERFSVRKIAALGAPFDPNFHEAVIEVDDASRPPGTVANVLEDGYTLHDRLVRPARVATVRRRANSSKAKDAESSDIIPQGDAPNHRR